MSRAQSRGSLKTIIASIFVEVGLVCGSGFAKGRWWSREPNGQTDGWVVIVSEGMTTLLKPYLWEE